MPFISKRTKVNWIQIIITVIFGLIFTHYQTNKIINFIRNNKEKIEISEDENYY